MSAGTLSPTGISPFGPQGLESPSEQIYVLSASQLQDLIERAVARATAPLEARIQDLEDMTARERAFDRQRIAKLEKPEPSRKTKARAEKIKRYIEARADHKATFENLKGHLGIKNDLLGDAIQALIADYPGIFAVVKPRTGDKRTRTLIMLPRY